MLRDRCAELPSVDLRFNLAFDTATQTEDGVQARLHVADGEPLEVRARYLAGADGARPAVRDLIGATMEGEYGLSRNYNVVFRAPGLAQAQPHGPGVMFWQVNGDGASLIGPMDKDDVWFFMPTGMKPGETLSSAEAAGAIRRATAIDLPYEVLSTDEWVASRLIASRYRQGACSWSATPAICIRRSAATA